MDLFLVVRATLSCQLASGFLIAACLAHYFNFEKPFQAGNSAWVQSHLEPNVGWVMVCWFARNDNQLVSHISNIYFVFSFSPRRNLKLSKSCGSMCVKRGLRKCAKQIAHETKSRGRVAASRSWFESKTNHSESNPDVKESVVDVVFCVIIIHKQSTDSNGTNLSWSVEWVARRNNRSSNASAFINFSLSFKFSFSELRN